MRNLKISTRLVLGFGSLFVLLCLIGILSLSGLGRVGDRVEAILAQRYSVIELLTANKDDTNSAAIAVRNALLAPQDEAALKRYGEQLEKIAQAIGARRDKIGALLMDADDQTAFQKISDTRQAYRTEQSKVLDLLKTNSVEQATALAGASLRDTQVRYIGAQDELIQLQKSKMQAAATAVESQIANLKLWLLLIGAVALVLAVTLTVWLTRSISGPIHDAQNLAMAVAAGDLGSRVESHGKDELAALLHALGDMQTKLSGIVSGIRTNAQQVALASAEIASGNNDLSSRTEHQASALEETAASMEQLGSTVRQNADNARQANQLAIQASSVAVQGGEVVARVVDTMKEINKSSHQISDIISVIDGIAFQTNILALNAAVEAARAGEQGRGFAVVASEVRSLAGRSAEAAKQIKSLITVSVDRVTQGTELVDQAGSTMSEVVTAIKRVTDIVGEITSASQEQNSGVAQVGEAITQMDQTTQQNAALVEQSAAAANSLKQQAEEMSSAMAFFKIGGDSGGHAPRAVGFSPAPMRSASPAPSLRAPAPKPAAPRPAPRAVVAAPTRGSSAAAPAAPRPAPAPKPAAKPAAAPVAAAKPAEDEWETF